MATIASQTKACSQTRTPWADQEDEPIEDDATKVFSIAEDDNSNAALPDDYSVGSQLHDSGNCKPCVYFHKSWCTNGKACAFCHRCPPFEKERRNRLAKNIRNRRAHPRGQGDDAEATVNGTSFRGGGYWRLPRHFRQDSQGSAASAGSTSAGSSQSSGPRAWSSDNDGEAWGANSVVGSRVGVAAIAWDHAQVAYTGQEKQQGNQIPPSVVLVLQPGIPGAYTQPPTFDFWAPAASAQQTIQEMPQLIPETSPVGTAPPMNAGSGQNFTPGTQSMVMHTPTPHPQPQQQGFVPVFLPMHSQWTVMPCPAASSATTANSAPAA